MFKLIIAGTRTFDDYDLLKREVQKFILEEIKSKEITVVSGKAPGADTLGERFASEYNLPIEPYPALWSDLEAIPCKIKYRSNDEAYNCLAGFNRNEQMAKVGTHCIVFTTGSPGSANMIELATNHELKVKVIKI